tara:strand:+ start:3762 stop:5150 length:1389 start_codon:yes stop_codon:yes gene_type:complete
MQEMEDMEGKFLPENIRYMVESMSQYSRNRFRLETVSADTASAGRIVTVNLPEGALLDLSSFRWHFDVLTTRVGDAGDVDTVYAKLPNDAQTLIQRVEVNMNGIAVGGQGANEWNTIYAMKKLGHSSLDRATSVDRALSHGEIDTGDTVDDESLVVADWVGFLGAAERSTRFLDTSIWGQIQVRITLAPNSVLVPKVHAVPLGTPLGTAALLAKAEAMSYSISNIYFTIDSISVNPIYNRMLRDRLQSDDFLPLNYKDQYAFSLDNITSGASTTRFSLSSGSIDGIYGVYRDSNYTSVGVVPKSLTGVGGAFVANYLRFRSYDSSVKKAGTFRENFSINNIQVPQYAATIMDCLADVSYVPDKVGMGAQGTLVTSKEGFHDGRFLCSQILNHPCKHGVAVMSGVNSRGINTMMTWQVRGQVIPAAEPAPAGQGTTSSISAFVMLDTTAQLRAGIGKNIVSLA